jgi:hypothetical protein
MGNSVTCFRPDQVKNLFYAPSEKEFLLIVDLIVCYGHSLQKFGQEAGKCPASGIRGHKRLCIGKGTELSLGNFVGSRQFYLDD